MNSEGKEQCEICREWFYPDELTVKEEGIWIIQCCEPCSLDDGLIVQLHTPTPIVKKPPEQLDLFEG